MTAETVTRCVTLPVREVAGGGSVIDTFRPAWRLATDTANWCERELVLADPGLRQPGQEKLEKCPPRLFAEGGLYARVTAACPFRKDFDGAAGSLSAITKAVEDVWRKHPKFGRYAVLWEGKAAPCVFRFPYPWPVRSQELRIYRNGQNRACASLTLPGGRVEVVLAGGPEFRRQHRQIDALLADPGRIGAAKVTGRFRCGKLVGADLRISGKFDRAAPTGDHAAVVHTDPNALLVCEIDGQPPWVLNFDHLTRWQAAHRVYLQRVGEDLKREKRMDRRQRSHVNRARELRCEKHRHRVRTALQQAAAQVARYCLRRGVGLVAYDDSVRGRFPDGFPWAELEGLIRARLESAGVEFACGKPQPV